MNKNNAALVTYRGSSLENLHRAHVAVVDEMGKLLYGFGEPMRITLARSAAKPAQALAVMETGAFKQFAFDDADLALMCASHSSEERHIDRTRCMLRKVQVNEADMRCGGHAPISDAVNKDWIKRDFTPTACCSNCSGKHVGMLGGAIALGQPTQGYEDPSHPLQLHVKRVVAEMCDLPVDSVAWAIDGCNLPTPAFPLDRLALMYAKLADAADAAEHSCTLDGRTIALARIFRAMTTHPEMVAGEGRYCTELMNAFGGEVVGKLGADACYGVGIRASEATRRLGANGAIGISVKIEDGNIDVLYMLVSEILERLRIGTVEQRSLLSKFHRPKMLNTMNRETGHSEFVFELDRY
ncbi:MULTISPECIES: asparaginase [Pseudomonas]|uniref:asparaginase n=1 Tax=Pseudomonas TaxID=286 RepID=UPI000761F453|nr:MULTISPECIES: asparaginase [Pseudomonas]MBA6104623.1 asparaginase [Pseudomonas monteilii]